ncbi:MAG: thioredoxin [Anaerolineae bacterium]|nr:thioredoxin [Anaerolineae bacterium]
MTTLLDVVDTSFDAQVLKCDIPVLADFWAEWCAPCKALTPHLNEIAQEFEGRLKIVKLDIDNSPTVASGYSVFSIPTLILFKFGQPVERIVGTVSKQDILDKVLPYLD